MSIRCLTIGLFAAGLILGCGQKKEPTEAEKGKEAVEKKLEYAEGASEALNEKGKPVGRSAGKGVGGLLKGIGSGLVDAIYPPVTITPTEEFVEAGIKVNKSEEGSSTSKGNEVNMTLAFSKVFKGRIRLHAFDKQNVELGRAVSKLLNQPADSILELTVHFDRNIRMSNIDHCDGHIISPKSVELMGDAASSAESEEGSSIGIELGQMQEGEGTPLEISQYVIFNQPFAGSLQLRAYDATDAEIGRSEKIEGLDQEADSSHTFEFVFHETLDGSSVARFGLHVSAEKKVKKTKKEKKGKK